MGGVLKCKKKNMSYERVLGHIGFTKRKRQNGAKATGGMFWERESESERERERESTQEGDGGVLAL